MGTIVKLYYTYSTISGNKWELIPSKLLVVEDIASYLATKTSKTINDFQYIKNELEIQINVDISQDYSQPRSETNFKYVSIQNPSEQIHYYFVKKATWRSKTCVRFELVMDVLNTFQEGRDFNFKANTRIVREHKDRFKSRRVFSLEFTIISSTGTIQVGDDIQLLNDHSDTCVSGHITSISSTSMNIIVDDEYTDEEIYESIEAYLGDSFEIWKDSSHYYRVDFNEGDFSINYYNYRNIDVVNEGISPVLQCGTAYGEKIENPSNTLKKNWFLLYRNKNNPDNESLTNPVDCYIIPEEPIQTDSGYIESGRLIPSWLEDGTYYYFLVKSGSTFTLSNGVSYTYIDFATKRILLIMKSGNKLSVQSWVVPNVDTSETYASGTYDDIDYITISGLPVNYNASASSHALTWSYLNTLAFPYTFNNSGTYYSIDGIDTLDKGDPKNIKLIKLPYVPYDFDVVSDVIQINDDDFWELVSFSQQSGGGMYALKLKDDNKNLKFKATIKEEDSNPLPNLFVGTITASISDLRQDDSYESKLFHSDFYQPTYVYDSFTYKVQMEKLNPDSYSDDLNMEKMVIHFYMTSTINSRFMFEFENLYFKYAVENYAKYMPIARNNEEVLYNVPYINYIRNGFNYDVKAKERTNASNVAGLMLSVGSTAASLLLPSVPLKVAGVVAGLVSVAMSIKNTVVSAQQNEDSIRRKLQETANQTASVAGSDDVDLMSVYAENRLKYLVYEPTPLMKSILFDLFFYAGYASGRMGKPNHNTRVNFDYLECEANLENEGSIPDDCLQELINCFKTGITYLHKTTRATDKWDFEQKYENWEKYLLED